MPYYGSVKIVDGSGWTKTLSMERGRVLVGSAASSDICLPTDRGGGVAAMHLQVIYSQADPSHLRIVNLVNAAIPLKSLTYAQTTSIPPNASVSLADGDTIALGDFSLTFFLQVGGGISRTMRSEHLGLKLELPGLQLRSGGKITGQVTVNNYGDQKRCQFEIELEGLPADCYQIDPAPLLYPGAEEHLRIRFFHRGARPPAGPCRITLHACAPGAYPTEEITVSEILDVLPVYRYEVSMSDGAALPAAAPIPQPQIEGAYVDPLPVPGTTAAAARETPAPGSTPRPQVEAEKDWSFEDPVTQPVNVDPVSRISPNRKPAVLRESQNIPVLRGRQESPTENGPTTPEPADPSFRETNG